MEMKELFIFDILEHELIYGMLGFFPDDDSLKVVLQGVLFEKLNDPDVYEKFNEYCRIHIMSQHQLILSMGEQ